MKYTQLVLLLSVTSLLGGCSSMFSFFDVGSNSTYHQMQRGELEMPEPKAKPNYISTKSLHNISGE